MMKRTWLIQRLNAPHKKTGGPLDALHNAFCFGGGGGFLSKQAWDLIDPIFSFDYMGAAEYEFGAVPEAITSMIKDQPLVEFPLTIPRDKIEKPSSRIPRVFYGKTKITEPVPELTQDPVVYVLCKSRDREDVTKRIFLLAENRLRIRDNSQFPRALDPISEYDNKTRGWLELDNGFFFTIDKEMAKAFAKLFPKE